MSFFAKCEVMSFTANQLSFTYISYGESITSNWSFFQPLQSLRFLDLSHQKHHKINNNTTDVTSSI